MKIRVLAVVTLALLAACQEKKEEAPQQRAELRKLSPNTFELVPATGQLPYCLIYTLSEKGVVRQLTLTRTNHSVQCEAGKPIGNVAYKAPVEEGPVRILIFFSSQPLNAGSVAQQIYELSSRNPKFTAMDLRLPGQVFTESKEFTPGTEVQAQEGSVVAAPGASGADAGTSGSGEDGGTK